jgi:acyl carrier protein
VPTDTIASLKSSQKATATGEVLANDVRTLIAHQLDVNIKRVTDEAHFTDDLGADWVDRLELMIVIEDRYADVVIMDEDVDQIEVVGDLIRHIETGSASHRRGAAPMIRKVMAAFSSRAVEPEQRSRVVLDHLSPVDLGRSARRCIGRVVLFWNEIPIRSKSSKSAYAHEPLVNETGCSVFEVPNSLRSLADEVIE